mmetsp:Transcript_25583/g.80722  ORF Transcript_25583/g.80722 Transcript_25583/m.80722 type:complete len:396 (+) Transcript_25583:259-1446(+)
MQGCRRSADARAVPHHQDAHWVQTFHGMLENAGGLGGAVGVLRVHVPEDRLAHPGLDAPPLRLLGPPVEGVRVADVRVRAPIVLVGMSHVGVDVPGLRLADDLGPHAVGLDVAVRAEQRHPVVHRLGDGHLGKKDAGARGPDDVADRRPDVLGLHQLRRDLPAPICGLGVAEVEQVCIRRQRRERARECRLELRRRRCVVLQDEERPLGVAGQLQAMLPGTDVRGGTAPLARAQLQRALLVGVQVVPALAQRALPLVHDVPRGVPGGAHPARGNHVGLAVRRREALAADLRAVRGQPGEAARPAVRPPLQVDDDRPQVAEGRDRPRLRWRGQLVHAAAALQRPRHLRAAPWRRPAVAALALQPLLPAPHRQAAGLHSRSGAQRHAGGSGRGARGA